MTHGLLFRLQATAGTDDDVARWLESDLPDEVDDLALAEWRALRFGLVDFGVLVTFTDREAEEAHVGERVAELINDRISNLLTGTPAVESFDVLAGAVVSPTA